MSVAVDQPAPGVGRILIDRPGARNAIDADVRAALRAALMAARDDAAVRALVIGGTGGVFCAGGDLPSLVGLSQDAAYARLRDGQTIVALLWSFPKPVVAAVERFAIGAGAGVALLADEIVMGRGAHYGFPFMRLGLIPDWGLSGSLPRRVGDEAAAELFVNSAKVGADRALALGLANQLVEDDAVMDRAVSRAMELAATAPAAFARLKARLRGDAEQALQLDREARDQAACIVSAEFAEGYAALVGKRTPCF